MKQHPIDIAAEIVGGRPKLAQRIGVSASQLHQWITGMRPIPIPRCVAIEKVTNGAVRCETLRPDLAKELAYLRDSRIAA